MKMAKLPTRKKSVNKIQSNVPRDITTAASDYITKWTKNELNKLQRVEGTPLCIPIKNGYKIGLYKLIVQPNRLCDVYDHNAEYVHTFESKISAVLYTILTLKRNFHLAHEIIQLDSEINKNYTDILSFRRSIVCALQRKDFTVVDVKVARLEIAETKLTLARERVSKLHNYAKWHKVWQ